MKKSIVLLYLIGLSFVLFAQEEGMREVIEKNQIRCPEIENTIYYMVPEYYEEGKYDSINLILEFWDDNCYEVDEIQWTRIMMEIHDQSLSEDEYGGSLLNLLQRKKGTQGFSSRYFSFGTDCIASKKYLKFMDIFAQELLERPKLDAVERYLLKFYLYENKRNFRPMKDERFDGTRLQREYLNKLHSQEDFSTLGMRFSAGIWTPTGKLNHMGVHPRLDYSFGYYSPRYTAMLDLGVVFLNSPEKYAVRYNDSLYLTNKFTLFMLGGTFGKTLIGSNTSKMGLLAGVAYNGLQTIKLEDDCDCDDNISNHHYLSSLNLNLGVEYQYYINETLNLFAKVKYNFLFIKNNGGTDLSGNAINISLGALIKYDSHLRRNYLELNDGYARMW